MTLKVVRRPNRRDSALPPKRITTAEYEAMIDAGVFGDTRLELLDGILVEKMTKKEAHVFAGLSLLELLPRLLPIGWVLWKEDPIYLGPASLPEPDFGLVRGTRRDYTKRRPQAADMALIIEISQRTLLSDRTTKLRLYALAGIVAYWIVNIPERRVEVYTQPDTIGGTYAARTDYAISEAVPVMLDGVAVGTVPVAELFD